MCPTVRFKVTLPFSTGVQNTALLDSLNANLPRMLAKHRRLCVKENAHIVELLADDPIEWCKAFALLWKTQTEPIKDGLFDVRKRRVSALIELYEAIPGVLGCDKFEFIRDTIKAMMFDSKIIRREDAANRPYWIANQYPDHFYEFELPVRRKKSDDPF